MSNKAWRIVALLFIVVPIIICIIISFIITYFPTSDVSLILASDFLPEKIEQAVQTALSAAEEQLATIDWTAYDRVFFLSKSIGTAIAARYAVQHNIHPRQVYYTPIEQALPYLDPTGIAFHGTADPWANTEMITNGCRKIGIPLYLTENANHSMETGDTLHDIFILHDIMDETAHWMDSPA